MAHDQAAFTIRLEWGLQGVEALSPISDVVIIVDILSFSTCVDIATGNGAVIYPYQWKDETADAYAKSLKAELATRRRKPTNGYSLSPASLTSISATTRLVLPSPNGSALSLATGKVPTLCGSLRNAGAVAQYAMQLGTTIAVIPAGEQWPDGTLRPALEDLLGAGAIISYLAGKPSPESSAALAVFVALAGNLTDAIKHCSSGKELMERGFGQDIDLACAFNVSDNVPILQDKAYVGLTGPASKIVATGNQPDKAQAPA